LEKHEKKKKNQGGERVIGWRWVENFNAMYAKVEKSDDRRIWRHG
jgi:hypothetical protein